MWWNARAFPPPHATCTSRPAAARLRGPGADLAGGLAGQPLWPRLCGQAAGPGRRRDRRPLSPAARAASSRSGPAVGPSAAPIRAAAFRSSLPGAASPAPNAALPVRSRPGSAARCRRDAFQSGQCSNGGHGCTQPLMDLSLLFINDNFVNQLSDRK